MRWLLDHSTVLYCLVLIPGCSRDLPFTPDILRVLSCASWHEFFIIHTFGPSEKNKKQTFKPVNSFSQFWEIVLRDFFDGFSFFSSSFVFSFHFLTDVESFL